MSHWGASRTLLVAFDTRVHTLVTPKSKIHDLGGQGSSNGEWDESY